jgi:hypothetical protein
MSQPGKYDWTMGPPLSSLFGDEFPLARDHPDWQALERGKFLRFMSSASLMLIPCTVDSDDWVLANWKFENKELKDYLMSSSLAPFTTMCEYPNCVIRCLLRDNFNAGFPFAERDNLYWACNLITLLFCLDEDLDRHRNLHLLPILKSLCRGTRVKGLISYSFAVLKICRFQLMIMQRKL